MSKEKIRRLNALADDRGVIAAAAMDQRRSLRETVARAKGVGGEEITDEMMRELKLALSKTLASHAGAVLLDPEWGLPAVEARGANTGLLLSYEQSGHDEGQVGRMPALLPNMSVRRLKELGADAVKTLVYYTTQESPETNEEKRAFVERVGAECRAEGLPFFLELVAYDHSGREEKGFDYARRKPGIVTESMREFSKERYGVDALVVEIPVDLAFAEGSTVFRGNSAYTKVQALDHFRAAAEAAERPFLYLSGDSSNDQFTESLYWAAEAGVNFAGVILGRASWAAGIPIYCQKGLAAFEEWLSDHGVRNIEAVNATLANAGSWYSFYGAGSPEALAD
jgi:tagatose 1,6-diphosphate aldolase